MNTDRATRRSSVTMPGIASKLRRGKGCRKVLMRLRERDGDNCWICGECMDFRAIDGGSRISASIDHVVPKRVGGSHLMKNLKLAHSHCNVARTAEAPKANTGRPVSTDTQDSGQVVTPKQNATDGGTEQ